MESTRMGQAVLGRLPPSSSAPEKPDAVPAFIVFWNLFYSSENMHEDASKSLWENGIMGEVYFGESHASCFHNMRATGEPTSEDPLFLAGLLCAACTWTPGVSQSCDSDHVFSSVVPDFSPDPCRLGALPFKSEDLPPRTSSIPTAFLSLWPSIWIFDFLD